MIPYFSTFFYLITEIVAGSFLQAYRNGISGVLLQLELTTVAFIFALLGSKVLSLARDQSLKFQYLLTFFHVIIFYSGLFFFINLFLSVNVDFVYPFSAHELSLRFTLALVLTSGFISALKWLEEINRNLDEIKLRNIVEIEFREEEVLATRSRISSALHGPIQGRLAGIAMALRFLEDENSPKGFDFSIIQDEIIPQLNLISKDIEKIFEGKKLREFSNSLEEMLFDLKNEWGRLLEIDWRISNDLKKNHNEGFIINVIDICNEAITNSVRHGQASRVFLDFKKDKDQVRLLIQNNGQQISDDFAYGVGLDSIEKLSENFKFENLKDGGVQLTVTLA
jgi:signal transduction histidine kinase